jgi:hypothetical protein
MKNDMIQKLKKTVIESEFKTQVKKLLKEEILGRLSEDAPTNTYTFNYKGRRYSVKFDVNSNDTKKGIKIQFLPVQGSGPLNPQGKQQLASELQVTLNQKLAPLGLTVDFDTDVPYQDVIGFTLKLGTFAAMVIKYLQAPAPPPAATPPPTASTSPIPPQQPQAPKLPA